MRDLGVIFGIPSYKRAREQLTLDYLERLGVPRDRIIMSVQTEDDLHAYTAAGVKNRVGKLLYRPVSYCADNRNTLLESVPDGTFMVLMDDDIRAVVGLEGGQNGRINRIDTYKDFMSLVHYGFKEAIKRNTIMFGLYPKEANIWMSDSITDKAIVVGQFTGRIVTPMRYDNRFHTKEDYEICCRVIREYGALPRLNNYASRGLIRSKGGMEEFRRNRAPLEVEARTMVSLYPDILWLNPRRPGEVLMKRGGRKS